MTTPILQVDGTVESPRSFSLAELGDLPSSHQIADASQLDPARAGKAIRLEAIVEQVRPSADVQYMTLHASADNFHASIPLADVRERAVIIYSLDGGPLPVTKGGPTRFFIPDHAACHTDEIDECANVKFLDRIEFSIEKGFDNRPLDEDEHTKLHQSQQ